MHLLKLSVPAWPFRMDPVSNSRRWNAGKEGVGTSHSVESVKEHPLRSGKGALFIVGVQKLLRVLKREWRRLMELTKVGCTLRSGC